jgi:hypothetical protein
MSPAWSACLVVQLPTASQSVHNKAARPSPKAPTVGSLQTLPPQCSLEESSTRVAKASGFSLHAEVSAAAHEQQKLERVCRYIALHGCRVLRRLGTIASAPDGL